VATEAETQLEKGNCDVSGLMLQNASYAKLKYIILWKSKYCVNTEYLQRILEQKSLWQLQYYTYF